MHYSFDIQGHGYFPYRYLSCSEIKGFDLYSINQRISRAKAKKKIMLWSYLYNSSRIFDLINIEED